LAVAIVVRGEPARLTRGAPKTRRGCVSSEAE
jgi:hypothetical protein